MRPVVWSTEAIEDLLTVARQDVRQATRISEAVTRFSRDGSGDIKKLKGESKLWRIRVGDWRVFYEDQPGQAIVVRVALRRDAYDD